MKKLLCVCVITVGLGWAGSTMAQGPLLQHVTKELGLSGNLDIQQESRTVLNLSGRFGYFPQNNLEIQTMYAYHLGIKDSKLSIGIKIGAYSQTIDGSK